MTLNYTLAPAHLGSYLTDVIVRNGYPISMIVAVIYLQ